MTCFVFAVVALAWVVESGVKGRVRFDGKYGAVEYRNVAGVTAGAVLLCTGLTFGSFGLAHWSPPRQHVHVRRAMWFGVSSFAFVVLTLLFFGIGWD
jgi:hypothetical protein